MATLLEVYHMAGNANLRNRVTASIAKLAYYIATTEDPGVANHANRLVWAKACLLAPETESARMLWAVLQNTDVQTALQADSLEDTLVDYVVGVLCNTFATGE